MTLLTHRGWLCVMGMAIVGFLARGEQQTVRYSYDAADRLVTVTYDKTAAIHYLYDESGNPLRRVSVGPGEPRADHNTNGLPDLWELFYFRNLEGDPGDDLDGDQFANVEESIAFTDPTNAASYLRVAGTSNQPPAFSVRWDPEPHTLYRVWWTDAVTNWAPQNSTLATNGIFTESPATNDLRLYRVTAE